jgi:hypothetical protein
MHCREKVVNEWLLEVESVDGAGALANAAIVEA